MVVTPKFHTTMYGIRTLIGLSLWFIGAVVCVAVISQNHWSYHSLNNFPVMIIMFMFNLTGLVLTADQVTRRAQPKTHVMLISASIALFILTLSGYGFVLYSTF